MKIFVGAEIVKIFENQSILTDFATENLFMQRILRWIYYHGNPFIALILAKAKCWAREGERE